jgi:peptidoglycan/LPS O-acetylase OafA/YrhL
MVVGGLRLVHLDMLRGLAAIGVVLGHVRSLIILDYGIAPEHSISIQLFYFFTSLGHQCVIAFFALSGFLVGGPALRNILDDRWSWPRYMLRRVTRLWIVLLPALLLTLGLDTAGEILGGRAGYEGAFYNLINSGPTPDTPADLTATTLTANVLFLQTITAPVFGSNGPLWSLANEFWYYVMFPFVLVGLAGRSWGLSRAVMGVVGIALAVILPSEMVLLGLIWIAGAVAQYSLRFVSPAVIKKIWLICLSFAVLLVIGFTILAKLRPGVLSDLLLGGAFACVLPILALLPNFGAIYDGVAGYLSKISYTLYATHFPVLAFIWFVALAPQKWAIGLPTAFLMAFLIVTTLLLATGLWWLFERNTDRIRKLVETWFLVRSAAWRGKWGT